MAGRALREALLCTSDWPGTRSCAGAVRRQAARREHRVHGNCTGAQGVALRRARRRHPHGWQLHAPGAGATYTHYTCTLNTRVYGTAAAVPERQLCLMLVWTCSAHLCALPHSPPRRPGQSTTSAHALHSLTLAMAFAGRAAVPAAGHTGRRGGPVGAGPARRHGCGHGAARGLPGRGAAADAAAAPGHRRQPAGGRPGAVLLQGQRTACILCSGLAWSWWRSWRNVYHCGPQRSLSRGGQTHPM